MQLDRFQATDKDAGKHGKIQYSLRGGDAKDFVINPETGTIYCTSLVDDSNVVKTFEVVAHDNDGKSEGFESVLSVTVSINVLFFNMMLKCVVKTLIVRQRVCKYIADYLESRGDQ